MIGELGSGLVFVLSQPRTGSTLLQRMLGAHPDVHTMQEPAVALYPLSGLRDTGHTADYDTAVTDLFVGQFLATLPDGRETYVRALRRMLRHLYDAALTGSGARLFVDKTPRYHFIVPELLRVFPEAAYVVLWRNPLAVLGSILRTWVRGEWLGIAHARSDLLDAPERLLDGEALAGERAIRVHYEALVTEPEPVMRSICGHLGVAYDPIVVDYGEADLPRWPHADVSGLHRYGRARPDSIDRWRAALDHPQIWRLSRDYLRALGPGTVIRMGYDPDLLAGILAERVPTRPARAATFSLDWLARRPPAERPWWHRRLVRLQRQVLGKWPRDEPRRV